MSNPDLGEQASSLQQVVGALLLGSERPLSIENIRNCLKSVEQGKAGPGEGEGASAIFAEATVNEVRDALGGIAKELSRIHIGIELVEVNRAFRFQTQPCCGPWVRNLLRVGRPARLSNPALETLAIIAYRQPIAKSEIEGIRGVMVDHIIKTLMELHLVRITGRSELPGRPFLYGTTPSFLEHFGLRSLKELGELDPTLVSSKLKDSREVRAKTADTGAGEAGDQQAPLPALREVMRDSGASRDAEPVVLRMETNEKGEAAASL